MKFGIRRRLLLLMLSGSLLAFLVLGLPLVYGLYGIYRTIDSKEEELAQVISYYAMDFAKEQNQEEMESETEIRAGIIRYEAKSVKEDTKYLSAELTNILRFPQKYTAKNLPNASKEIVPAGTVYIHFSPDLQNQVAQNGLSQQLKTEMTLLSNVAVTMNTLRQYYKCICVASRQGYVIRLDEAEKEGAISDLSQEPWRSIHDARQRYWYQVGEKATAPEFTEVYRHINGKQVISCVMPYYDGQGQVAGVVVLDCDPSNFLPEEDEGITRSFVLGEKGDLLLSSLPQDILSAEDQGKDLRESLMPSMAFAARRMVQGGVGYRKMYLPGADYYLSYAPVYDSGWSVGTLVEDEKVKAVAHNANLRMTGQMEAFRSSFARLFLYFAAVAVFILLAVFGLVSWGSNWAAEHFCRPLRRLMEATREIAQGNFAPQIAIRTGDELEHLGQCMGTMTQELARYEQEIARTAQEKSRIETELSVAAQIQASLLPSPLPSRSEFQLAAAMYPAKEVGGDFYDFYYLSEDKLVLTIADVSDKGVPAALFMAAAKTMLKNCIMGGLSLPQAMAKANDQLAGQNEAGMFVTVFAGVMNLATGELTYVNAGHNPPLFLQGEEVSTLPLTKKSPLLGAMAGLSYEEKSVHLASGDRLFLYTDGITEAMNTEGEIYTRQRLEQLLNRTAKRVTPEDIIESVLQQVHHHIGEAEQSDDMTMLVFKYNPNLPKE